jgi:hypothetical protein
MCILSDGPDDHLPENPVLAYIGGFFVIVGPFIIIHYIKLFSGIE